MRTFIYVKTQFAGLHCWKDAPDDIAFLRSLHRHTFHVKVTVEVTHNDRQVEYFQLKRILDGFIGMCYHEKEFEYSCEQIAESIMRFLRNERKFSVTSVDVNEDGDNGSIVVFE